MSMGDTPELFMEQQKVGLACTPARYIPSTTKRNSRNSHRPLRRLFLPTGIYSQCRAKKKRIQQWVLHSNSTW